MRRIDLIVLHCSAASGDQPTQNVLDYWRSLGHSSNGYHWMVDEKGVAVRLQGDHLVSNGVRGHNAHAIHICYKGGWNKKDTRTDIQKLWLEMKVQEYLNKYPNAKVIGHRDLSPDKNGNGVIEAFEWLKVCPCFDAKKEYAHLKPQPQ
jgi:N-acetylmuramoyl-L-alanine amidase